MIAQDKLQHFVGGALIACLVLIATGSLPWAFAATLAVAVAKELYDACHTELHTPEVADVVATVVGCVLPWLAWALQPIFNL